MSCDASDSVIGAVLEQVGDDGLIHPVYYYSRKFQGAQRNCPVTDKECLAVVLAFRNFDVVSWGGGLRL
jgi:RNase H-like domain found in reverse transcriptase